MFGRPPLADRLTGYPAGHCARILPTRVSSRGFRIPRYALVRRTINLDDSRLFALHLLAAPRRHFPFVQHRLV